MSVKGREASVGEVVEWRAVAHLVTKTQPCSGEWSARAWFACGPSIVNAWTVFNDVPTCLWCARATRP